MTARKWSNDEIEELKHLIDANYTKTQLAEHFNRTKGAISLKVNRLGLQIINCSDSEGCAGRHWKDDDINLLIELWEDTTISIPVMKKRLKRNWSAIRNKATELKLGPRDYDTAYLSIQLICDLMNVSDDRVRHWLKLGLKYHKNKSGRVKYAIDADDLLEFLENHQDLFDASFVSEDLFIKTPKWLKDKMKLDSIEYAKKNQIEYTNEEDKIIVDMFFKGYSDEKIAKRLGRTASAIKYHRMVLGVVKSSYNPEEIEILKAKSDYLTLDELAKLLPLRTPKGIEAKCKSLGLPYHSAKHKCKKMEN